MARLIDADQLIALLNKKYNGDENINESVLYLVGAISGANTVDAEPVVRCKDCWYYATGWCRKWLEWSDDDNGFCSWGESK